MVRFSKASVVLLKTQEKKRLLDRVLSLSDNVARPSYTIAYSENVKAS